MGMKPHHIPPSREILTKLLQADVKPKHIAKRFGLTHSHVCALLKDLKNAKLS